MSWAFDVEVGDPTAKLLLLKLADRANDDGKGAYFARRSLTKFCECSKPTITRKVAYLRELGLVSISQRKRDNGSQTSNEYILNVPWEQQDTPDQSDQGGDQSDQGGVSPVDHPRDVPLDVPLKNNSKNSDSAILPSNCRKHLPDKICNCRTCKQSVNRLIVNGNNLWPDRFVISTSQCLLEHWSRWKTDIPVDDIMRHIDETIKRGKKYPAATRKQDLTHYATAIDNAIVELEYRRGNQQ